MAARWYLAYAVSYQDIEKLMAERGVKIVIDKSRENKAALDSLNLQLTLLFLMTGILMPILVRQIKYQNNIIEQNHRAIKKIIHPMKGFKSFTAAKATLAGIELHHMLRKWQHADAANLAVYLF